MTTPLRAWPTMTAFSGSLYQHKIMIHPHDFLVDFFFSIHRSFSCKMKISKSIIHHAMSGHHNGMFFAELVKACALGMVQGTKYYEENS